MKRSLATHRILLYKRKKGNKENKKKKKTRWGKRLTRFVKEVKKT